MVVASPSPSNPSEVRSRNITRVCCVTVWLAKRCALIVGKSTRMVSSSRICMALIAPKKTSPYIGRLANESPRSIGCIFILLRYEMELRDLRYFLAVAETASFTRAAERLGMAQPPLSRHIAGLEARLNCPLFRRVRPLELTEAGRFLFEQARQVLNKMEELEAATRRFASGRKQLFSIGFVGSTLYGPLPKAI